MSYLDRLRCRVGACLALFEERFSALSLLSIPTLVLPPTASGNLISFSFKFSTLLAKSSIDCFLGEEVAVLLLLIERRSIPAWARFSETSECEKSGGAVKKQN